MKKITLIFVVIIAVVSLIYNGIYEHENRQLWKYYFTTERELDSLDIKYNISDELSSEYYDIKEVINN